MRQIQTLSQLESLRVWDFDRAVEPVTSDEAKSLLSKPLTAESAVRIALLNNRALRAQLRELGIARGELIQAGVLPNPIVEAKALPERNTLYEFRVEYNMTGLVLAPLRYKVATARLQAERRRAANAVIRLGYEIRSAFYAAQAVEQRLGAARKAQEAFAAGRDAAVALLEAGNISPLDASAQIATFERARIATAQIEIERMEHRENLQRLFGLHGQETTWTMEPELPSLPNDDPAKVADSIERKAIEANLELAAMRYDLEAVARSTGLSRVQGWLPDINVDVHSLYGRRESPVGSGSQWAFGGGVSLSIPIFDRLQGTTRSREAEFDGKLERYYGLAIDVRSHVRAARNRLLSAHARARQFAQVIVPAQNTVFSQTLLQYNAMQLSVFQLLQARRDQLDVEMAYADTLREYWTAVAALNAILAGSDIDVEHTASSASTPMRRAASGEH